MTGALITPRRGFLRAFGLTAAGASVAVPIITLPTAEERFRHHLEGAARALGELIPGVPIALRANCLDGHHRYYAEAFAEDASNRFALPACAMVMAGPGVIADGQQSM